MNKIDMMFDNGSNIYFTADHHFNHTNVIQYCNRPFSTIMEMNEALINNWNSVVSTTDIVFYLGDFAFGGVGVWRQFRSRLNGNIIFIKGNHDDQNWSSSFDLLFEHISRCMLIRIENQPIYLTHFPLLCFDGAQNGQKWNFFGHVHSGPKVVVNNDSERVKNCFPTQYDVGVDNNNYTPVSFHQIRDIINQRINLQP